ncbi:DUF485 domain-containing protein [Actinophytocola sp.]|uniref:DUF485 domain-containing protein n=1 Tax=Actinophytocola sp. TaxID=1872138 RepID=UPI002ED31942
MTHPPSFARAPETGRYVAFESGEDVFSGDLPESGKGGLDYATLRDHPDFVRVQSRLTRFVVPASVLFFTWYMTYVLLAAYAHDFMSHRVVGSVTVALLLGLSQFVVTVVIMLWYARFARTKVDPEIERLRAMAGENDHDR